MPSVRLTAGMEAPHFELPDADMETFALTSQRDRNNVVLYFYPRDDTPGCTMEANEFSELEEEFAKFDTAVIGISRDDCLSHASFRDKHGLSVLLLSDPDARVCKRYGVMVEKEVDGHKKHVVQRSTFIIDKQGLLRHAMYGVHAHGHAQEIFNLIKELK
ncbi:MAG: peroxiredoxin [Gallionellales bacterium RIFCSPLOWO2_12_FULL_59_22]|nr:MAG: peroxiredoxin [Gallionellales bacterium RIFCSPLOWO2_02_FULL_59_110]OGT05381.1 MAG: peroxiredoxin [Gallionellales bacterium RIFCSPLOWO2_02_58_13]OGT12263.1 MAG: peroxiredoxin [Gallionellales bacterium RIFCSPLOWO2_12_FULL_59_22]